LFFIFFFLCLIFQPASAARCVFNFLQPSRPLNPPPSLSAFLRACQTTCTRFIQLASQKSKSFPFSEVIPGFPNSLFHFEKIMWLPSCPFFSVRFSFMQIFLSNVTQRLIMAPLLKIFSQGMEAKEPEKVLPFHHPFCKGLMFPLSVKVFFTEDGVTRSV